MLVSVPYDAVVQGLIVLASIYLCELQASTRFLWLSICYNPADVSSDYDEYVAVSTRAPDRSGAASSRVWRFFPCYHFRKKRNDFP